MDEKEFYYLVEPRDDWIFAHLSRKETKEVTHSYHKYPAKFIPQLARALIQEFTVEGDLVWDSFCGSGTLNVEAFRTHRHSLGTDINPVAVLITHVKTSPLKPKNLKKYNDELLSAINKRSIKKETFYISKRMLNGNIEVLRKWFSATSLRELGHILWQIHESKVGRNYQKFALCAFSSILKRSSYWLNSSIKAQIDPHKKPQRPFFYFEHQLRVMEKANSQLYYESKNNTTKVHIFGHDAKRPIPSKIKTIDCIITSPPYLVSYDYSDIFRLSNYFLFYQQDFRKFRKKFIGTPLKKNKKNDFYLLSIGQEIINSIDSTGLKRTISEYYNDMEVYFENAQSHLKEDGRLILIVGDTELRGVKIPNAYLLAELADGVGLPLEKAYSRNVPIKILPTLRDATTGKFTNKKSDNYSKRYEKEYILIFRRRNK